MNQFCSGTPETAKQMMPSALAKAALVFGLIFVFLYVRFEEKVWAHGLPGGMEFGTILWLPTIALSTIGSGVWYDKTRPLLNATFWAWLVRLNVAGIVAALLVG